MVPPRAGELVDQRLGAVAVGGDQRDRQVGADEQQRAASRRRAGSAAPWTSADGADRAVAPRRQPRSSPTVSSSCSSASAAASHSAARPASAIIARASCRPCARRPGCRAAAACSARHAWRGYCRRRTCRRCEPALGDHAAAFAEQVGDDAAIRRPASRALPSLTTEADRDAVGLALDRARLDHPAEPHRLARRRPCRRRCRPACRNRRRGPCRPHIASSTAPSTATIASDDQHQPLVLGLHLARLARRPRPRPGASIA